MKMVVIGQEHSTLSHLLAQHFKTEPIFFTQQQFADTEQSVQLEATTNLTGTSVFCVFQFHRNANSFNDQLVALLCLLHHIKVRGAKTISLLIPYLPYGRQEVADDGCLPGAVYAIGHCLQSVGVDNLYSCDLHEPSIANKFPVALHHRALTGLWVKTIQASIVPHARSLCIVSPDEGGRNRAAAVADALGLPCVFIRKTRIKADQVVTRELVGDVHDKNVIIVDDIVDTAGTVINAYTLLKKHGAKNVYGCFTHAVFAQEAQERLRDVGFEHVFVTDTIINGNVQPIDWLSIVSMNDFLIQSLD